MEDKLDIIISLLKKMIPNEQYSNKINVAAYLIAGNVTNNTFEQTLYNDYLTKQKEMDPNNMPINLRLFNKLVREMNPDMILKNTTRGGVQVRIWKEK